MSKRIECIDIAKGIGIILVVLGHMPTLPRVLNFWIYSFHMPLFFFISGYLFRKRDILVQIRKKSKSLLVPYLGFSFIFALLYLIFFRNVNDFNSNLINTLNGKGGFSVLWFFVSLFLIQCIFNIIVNKFNKKTSIVVIILLTICGYILCLFHIGQIFNISTSLVSLCFFATGYFSKNVMDINKYLQKKYSIVIASVINILFCFLSIHFIGYTLDIHALKYGNIIFTYLSAISGIYATIYISQGISNSRGSGILKYIGRNSLWFYPLTAFIPVCIEAILEAYTNLNVNFIIKIITKIIAFAIPVLIIEFKQKFKNEKIWG